jgi:hypothetical protein
MIIGQPFVILALNHPSGELFERTILKRAGLPFKAVDGVYKGKTERSYVVPLSGRVSLVKLCDLAHTFKQESILSVYGSGEAFLVDPRTYGMEYLGVWHSVPPEVAAVQTAYTFDPSTKTYYVAG